MFGVEGGREIQEEGDIYVLMANHIDVWQKPTQHCKKLSFSFKKADI